MAETGPTSYDGFLSYSHAADDLSAPRLHMRSNRSDEIASMRRLDEAQRWLPKHFSLPLPQLHGTKWQMWNNDVSTL